MLQLHACSLTWLIELAIWPGAGAAQLFSVDTTQYDVMHSGGYAAESDRSRVPNSSFIVGNHGMLAVSAFANQVLGLCEMRVTSRTGSPIAVGGAVEA